MKKYFFTFSATVFALLFWFFDSFTHYFIYGEDTFEFIPEDFNELWMRLLIIALVIFLGIHTDYSTRRLLKKEKQLEATRVYDSMLYATHHILNNLLNQMMLFKLEAQKSTDFDPDVLKYFDNSITEAQQLIRRLSDVSQLTHENIWASVDPGNIHQLSSNNQQTDTDSR